MIATWMRWLVRDERGSVLVGGLMLVLVMTLVGSGVFYAAVLDNRAALNDGQQTQAVYIAQAGLNAALRELTNGDGMHDFATLSTSSTTTLFTNRPFGGGSFTATAIPVSNPSGFMVRSTACVPYNCPTGHTEVTVQRSITGQAQQGNITGGSYFLFNTFSLSGGIVDNFDSSQTTCQTNPANCYTNTVCHQTVSPFTCGAEVHTNGVGASSTTPTVTVAKSSDIVYGNIFDWQGRVSISGTVYGNVTYRSDKGDCPNCPPAPNTSPPPNAKVKGTVHPVTTGGPEVMPQISSCTSNGGYTSNAIVKDGIHVTGGANFSYDASTGDFSSSGGQIKTLTLAPMTATDDPSHNPPGYCFHSFTVSGGVSLYPRTQSGDGNVIIYVTGPVSITGQSNINNLTAQSTRFQIRSSYNTLPPNCPSPPCVGVTISGGAIWYIYVYAPYTQISTGGGATLYGALIGYDLVSNQASLHYDKTLRNGGIVQTGGGGLTYTWGTWQACKNPTCT